MRYALVGLLVLLSSTASATDYRVLSSTYYRGFSQPGATEETRHYPFYEFVTLNARDVGVSGLSVDASLWGKVDTGDVQPYDNRAAGDVNILSLTYRAPHESLLEGLEVRAGRQFIPIGPTMYEQFDGGYASYRLPYGFNVSAFGGAVSGVRFVRQQWPVNNNDFEYGPNWTVGGRAGYNYGDYIQTGVGYRQKRLAGRLAFNEIFWDAGSTPIEMLYLSTDGAFDFESERLKQIRAAAQVTIRRNVFAGAGYRFTSPDLFVPRSSIFAVFSNESYQEVFGDVDWGPYRWLNLHVEAAGIFFGEACLSGTLSGSSCDSGEFEPRLQGRADFRFGMDGKHRATFETERFGARDGSFWRWRLAGSFRLTERITAITDFDMLLVDGRDPDSYIPADGRSRFGFSGSGYLMVAARRDLSLLFGGQGMVSPLYSHAGSFMVRLNWLIDGEETRQGSGPVAVSRSSSSSLYGGML